MRIRRHSRGHGHGESHGIDLAPMLDFVLNLLIFFIIIAVFVKELGLEVNRPGNAEATSSDDAGSIPINVLANGEVWIEGRAVDVRAVRANVERLYSANPKGGVLIISDEAASTGLVVQVVDQVHQGGIYNVTFATAN